MYSNFVAPGLTPALLALAAYLAAISPTACRSADLSNEVTSWARGLDAEGYLSGVLLVAHADSTRIEAVWGVANHDYGVRNNANTRFAIASLSKPMTAVALLRLVEVGSLSPDDSVARWIPDMPFGDQMTVRHLLTHQARVPHRVTTPMEETVPLSPIDIVARIREQGLPGPPDGTRAYSSAGYTVIARIIELVTGTNFASAMDSLVFRPLHMAATLHADSRSVIPGRASPYYYGAHGAAVNAPLKDLSFLAGGGSLWSTASDVLRFAQAYLERRLLSGDSWDAFHALGWANRDVVRWSGSTNGWFSFLDFYESDRIVAVFLGNNGMGAVGQLRSIIPAIVLDQPYEAARPAPPAAVEDTTWWAAVAGSYVGANDVTQVVTVEQGSVWLNGSCLRPLRAGAFFNPLYWVEVEFVIDGSRATELKLLIPGRTRVYTRAE